MLEEIRKILFSGLGLILLTREKAEEVTRKLVEEARLSKEEAKELVDELATTGSMQWSDMEESLTRAIRKSLANLDVAGKKELQDCRSRVADLEKHVEVLQKRIGSLEERVSAPKEG